MIISSNDYHFKLDCSRADYSMNKNQMRFVIEINKLNIVTSDRIMMSDLLKKTYRSRFSGDMKYMIKPTPFITDDQDTICFIKYFLHNRVKKNLINQCKYDELMSIGDIIQEF
jgi:hypothetical protein